MIHRPSGPLETWDEVGVCRAHGMVSQLRRYVTMLRCGRLLSLLPSGTVNAFHPLSSFGVHVKLSQKVKTIPFPSYAYFTHNHYNPGWSLNTHRRLKNIIIMLEWVPGRTSMLPPPSAPDRDHQVMLRRAVDMFDARSSGRSLNEDGLKDAFAAIDLPQHERSAAARELGIDQSGRGEVSADAVCAAIATRSVFAMEYGRYYAMLSLPEAEACRAIMHARLGEHPVAESPAAHVALHSVVYPDQPVDAAMPLPQQRGGYQREMIRQALRFADSEHSFPDHGIDAVLRSGVQHVDQGHRRDWYEEVRSCRRRQKTVSPSIVDDPLFAAAGVTTVFRVKTEYERLALRATKSRVKNLILARGLHVVDAFRAFNSSRTGNCCGVHCNILFRAVLC